MSLSKMRRSFISFFFLVFLVNASVVIWLALDSTRHPTIMLAQAEVKDTPSLCPGEILHYAFIIDVDGPATVILDYSLDTNSLHTTPVRSEQIDFDTRARIELRRQFPLPTSLDWKAGVFVYRVQAKLLGDVRGDDAIYIPFEVRGDCFDD